MILEHFKLLAPGFLLHWSGTVFIVYAAWFVWSKLEKTKFRPLTAVLTGTVLSLVISLGTVATTMHTARYNEYNAAKRAAVPPPPGSPDTDPMAQLKSAFLKTLDSITQKPDQYNSDVKIKLLQTYQPLFPNGRDDYAAFRDQVTLVYRCQRVFIEDLGVTLKKRKPVKSSERENCENAPGAFFYRAKLLPPEVIKHNNETIETLAKTGKLPGTNGGKGTPITQKDIANLLTDQDRAIAIINNIFE